MSLNPDLVFDRGRAVADVKYKLHDGTWNRPDLYQATTFATGYRTRRAAILCFDERTAGAPAVDIGIGDVALRTICWPCATHVSPVQAEDALVHACDAWLAHDLDAVHTRLRA